MESSRRAPSKFTCYFCNKTIDNESEIGHTAVCGNVLLPCTNKCGAYIPRKDNMKHKKECINRITKSMPRLPGVIENPGYNSLGRNSNSSSVSRNANGYHETLHPISNEILKLSRKISQLEQSHSYHEQQIQHNSTQNYELLKNKNQQHGLELEKLKYQNKVLNEWKNNIDLQLSNINRSLATINNANQDFNMRWIQFQNKLMALDKVEREVHNLRESFFKEQDLTRQIESKNQQELANLKFGWTEDQANISAAFNQHQVSTENLIQNFESIKKLVEEQKAKMANIIFDVRTASQIASETMERMEIQDREHENTKKEIQQIKLDIEILENLSSSLDGPVMSGRLLWKLTGVKDKMQKAKELGSVIKSPVFNSHDYGYKIRILLYMNGLKKWKDRYALFCIHVLKGEYDMLLEWPCHIEGRLTLRNIDINDQEKPFSKIITAKRQQGDEESEEPQESNATYIFIPHSTLLKPRHVKNDTLFIDIKIENNKKLETSL